MRIGYLVPEFPGQTHAFFWREISCLREMGVPLNLISTRSPKKVSHLWAPEAAAETTYLANGSPLDFAGAALEIMRSPKRWSVLREAMGSLKMLAATICAGRLGRTARKVGLTHIHVHSCANSALIALIANQICGLTYSLTLHGPLKDYGDRQAEKFGSAKFATTITETLRKAINEIATLRVEIAPMGVDTKKFDRPSPYIPWKDGPLKLFSCARLNLTKGHKEIADAMRILRYEGIDVHLTIAGEDDSGGKGFRAELERAAWGLPVTLLGAVSEERIIKEMEACHFFVLASWSEPLGVSIMEAMSCGVPVISTNAGGVPDLITNGVTGLLVQPRNPRDLANGIKSLMRDEASQKRFSVLGRKAAVERMNSMEGAVKLLNLLKAVHNPHHCCWDEEPSWERAVGPSTSVVANINRPIGVHVPAHADDVVKVRQRNA